MLKIYETINKNTRSLIASHEIYVKLKHFDIMDLCNKHDEDDVHNNAL